MTLLCKRKAGIQAARCPDSPISNTLQGLAEKGPIYQPLHAREDNSRPPPGPARAQQAATPPPAHLALPGWARPGLGGGGGDSYRVHVRKERRSGRRTAGGGRRQRRRQRRELSSGQRRSERGAFRVRPQSPYRHRPSRSPLAGGRDGTRLPVMSAGWWCGGVGKERGKVAFGWGSNEGRGGGA